jgi:uncharacterized protein DUF5710
MLLVAMAPRGADTVFTRLRAAHQNLRSLRYAAVSISSAGRPARTRIIFSDASDGVHLWTKKQQMQGASLKIESHTVDPQFTDHSPGGAMYPIDLTVPEAERAMALELGARWSEKEAEWSVPRRFNAEPFNRWLTARKHVNVRASALWLARVNARCPACATSIPLYGLILPAGHQSLITDDDPADDVWDAVEEPSQLYDVAYVSPALQAALSVHAPSYRLGYSAMIGDFGWMNYCFHCREQIEDESCALEFGSPLYPLDEFMAARIRLKELRLDLEVTCSRQSCGVPFVEAMPRTCS